MSEGTVHPFAQPVGRTHAAGAFDWRAVPSADPRASAFALDTAPALPVAAEEFSGEACREIVEDLLDRTRTGAAVAEVHAPFCESKCDGCGCWQHAYKELESRRWADALVREMAAWADTHAQAGAPIQALRFGGGTPSALEPVDILHVLAKARQYLPLSNDCSIELQARVHGFSEEKLEAALAGGVTRFVLPVRSFSTEVRQAAGRLDAGGAAEKLLKRLTEYNESAVAVELNFGLPGQSLEVWTADLERACQLPLDGLMIRAAGEPDMLGEAAKTFRAADPALMARMHERAFEVLADNGWERRTALAWSRSERDRTTFDVLAAGDADKFAFGCGAHGRLFGRELLIEPELGEWLSAVWMGRRPVSSVAEPKSGWRAAALLAQGALLGRFSLERIEHASGLRITESLEPLFDNWTAAGLLRRTGALGTWIRLADAGLYWHQALAARMALRIDAAELLELPHRLLGGRRFEAAAQIIPADVWENAERAAALS